MKSRAGSIFQDANAVGLLCHCSLGQWQWEGTWVSVSGKGLFIKDTALGDVVVLRPSLSKGGEQDK